MLRSIRLRLGGPVPPVRPCFLRCYASSQAQQAIQIADEPYGTEYGAGPSRIPYSRERLTYIHPPDPIATTQYLALLRRKLKRVPAGAYSKPEKLVLYLDPLRLDQLSKLEIHTLIHHLIRNGKPLLAASIMSDHIQLGIKRQPRRRIVFHMQTLRKLYTSLPFPRLVSQAPSSFRPPRKVPIDYHSPRQPSVALKVLLQLLKSLQSVRHQRPTELYEYMIHQALAEESSDIAAKIYVGMVEEWVTEGRVAEGADLDDFHPGGGPPREFRRQISAQLRSWWKGVRTWTLPGEVISPHDRLDLWHPENLLLGEKMRNFPYAIATSPPSLVPPPVDALLSMILDHVKLDPLTSRPDRYASSMRALAILANTVLARTLPVLSLKPLLQAFERTKSSPPIYPAGMKDIPKSDAWAYEAYTHIHLALQSLFFSPPISATSLHNAKLHDSALHPTPSANPEDLSTTYRLRPLNWSGCMLMVQYAFKVIEQPKILHGLMKYIKDVFDMGGKLPQLWNMLYRGASRIKDNYLAQQAEDVLFRGTALAKIKSPAPAPTEMVKGPENAPLLTLPETKERPEPDEESLYNLIKHLGFTSQFDRLEGIIHRLLPSTTMEHREGTFLDAPLDDAATVMPIRIFAALLISLEKGRKTTLAMKVYNQALRAEALWVEKFMKDNMDVPETHALPIEAFNSMLLIWENETNSRSHLARLDTRQDEAARWRSFATKQAWDVYLQARHRWNGSRYVNQAFKPDERFFDAAVQASATRWGLTDSIRLNSAQREELGTVLLDMEDLGVTAPPALTERFYASLPTTGIATAGIRPLHKFEYRITKRAEVPERPFAAVLAEMTMDAMAKDGHIMDEDSTVDPEIAHIIAGEFESASIYRKRSLEMVEKQGASDDGSEIAEGEEWEERRAFAAG